MKRLREYDTVTVNVPIEALEARTIDFFDARVLAIVGPTAALEPTLSLERLQLPSRAPETLLSFRHGAALVGLKGTLAILRGSNELRFTVADGVQLNRRSATRIKIALPLTIRHENQAQEFVAHTIDLSADGILVETDATAVIGDRLHVTIPLDGDDTPVMAGARVVRHGGGLIAMQFAAGESQTRSRLGRFVVQHNREELRSLDEARALVEF